MFICSDYGCKDSTFFEYLANILQKNITFVMRFLLTTYSLIVNNSCNILLIKTVKQKK